MQINNLIRKTSPILIIVLAIGIVIWGLWLAERAYSDYAHYHNKSVHFNKASTIQDLGTVLSGSVGALFTLSGIVLLLFTIYQTKAEMVATQNIMAKQLTESTFFNLLKNHKDVILKDASNKDAFSMEIVQLKNKLKLYIECINRNEFPNVESTNFGPSGLYNSLHNLRPVAESLVHILNFVEEKLKEESSFFYQRTFYSTLNNEEKYLLGFVVKNELEKTVSSQFNYCHGYLLTLDNPDMELSNLFMPITLKVLDELQIPSLNYEDPNVKQTISQLPLLALELNPEVALKQLDYSSRPILLHPSDVLNIMIDDNTKSRNIFELIAEPIFTELSDKNEVSVFLTYHCEYSSVLYKIHHRFIISKSNYISINLQLAKSQKDGPTKMKNLTSSGYSLKTKPIND